MERLLFSPCNRLQDILESQGGLEEVRRRHSEPLQELNLDVSTEELLSAERAFTYADLHALLGNEDTETLAWLTPHAAVTRVGRAVNAWEHQLGRSDRFRFSADSKNVYALASSFEQLLQICNIVLRLLAASDVHAVRLHNCEYFEGNYINAPSLAHLMERCQSLKVLTLVKLVMDEDHCRVLGAYSRPDLEIVLDSCTITDAGAITLAEVLARNQGPTNLDWCNIDNYVLANGLRGNSRLKSWRPLLSDSREVAVQQVLAVIGALRENKGLVDLNLSYRFKMSDETWGAICDSLKKHPTLEVLELRFTGGRAVPALPAIKSRIQALLDMMKVNMSIHSIRLNHRYSEDELFRGSVIPYLETNRFRPRLLAIQQTRPIPYRAKILGRALLAVRTDPNSFWMLLSGNAEVAFPSSTTTTTTPATSLPTPATVDASANAASVAANHVTNEHPATNNAALASGQKRKVCP